MMGDGQNRIKGRLQSLLVDVPYFIGAFPGPPPLLETLATAGVTHAYRPKTLVAVGDKLSIHVGNGMAVEEGIQVLLRLSRVERGNSEELVFQE